MIILVGCGDPRAELSAEVDTVRLETDEIAGWAGQALESGHHEITVRQVFTAQGPCRELEAGLTPRYPGEFTLRVEAREAFPCEEETPHIGYTARLLGLPVGSHRLRVVHVGADGRTLAETVLDHPVVVTSGPAGENDR